MSEVKTRNVLQMQFTRSDGKVKGIRISDPKTGLTAEQIRTSMETIVSLNAFNSLSEDGVSPTAKGARTIQTVTNDFGISFN